MSLIFHNMRIWDVSTSSRVDAFLANSTAVAARINKFYRRESEIIHPPCDVDDFEVCPPDEISDKYLMAGQLVAYKRPDIAIKAFNLSGRPLVVIGEGEELERLKKMANKNIEFLGRVSFETLKFHYSHCRALIFPGEEDFGIVPVEAMASGRPVIALKKGGALDTVVEGLSGIFFEEANETSLNEAIAKYENNADAFDPFGISAYSMKFSKAEFKKKMIDRFKNYV